MTTTLARWLHRTTHQVTFLRVVSVVCALTQPLFAAEASRSKVVWLPAENRSIAYRLEQRRQEQTQAAAGTKAFRDFHFTNRVATSGITFQDVRVDDALKHTLPTHYDHGNGMAVADVDGDGRLDIYLVTMLGSNALYRNLGGGRFEDITEKAGSHCRIRCRFRLRSRTLTMTATLTSTSPRRALETTSSRISAMASSRISPRTQV
jgi:hypothetical protein